MGAAFDTVEKFWKMIETGDFGPITELSRDDCECVMPGGMVLHGPAEVQPMLEAYHRAFPDQRHTVLSVIEDGDKVAVELAWRGVHSGPMATPIGEFPATGNVIEFHSTDVITLHDGQIASWHAYYDPTPMFVGIGAIAAPVG